MAKRTVVLECTDCNEKFRLTCESPESIVCCPFCTVPMSVPIDDVDDGEIEDESSDGDSVDDD